MPDQKQSPVLSSPWLADVPDTKHYSALSGDVQTDVVIVGGGIVGVLTAWQLAQTGIRVVILEKNHIATGDTSATTGFLTRVPDTSIADLSQRYGKQCVRNIFSAAHIAQTELFDLITTKKIECDFIECETYYSSYGEHDAVLEEEWKALHGIIEHVNQVERAALSDAPFQKAIHFEHEGSFHVRKFIFGLLQSIKELPIQIYEESEVLDVDLSTDVVVKTEKGTVHAKKIIVTTGKPIEYFSETHTLVTPLVSYVMAVQFPEGVLQLSSDLFWDTFDPYFYYRKIDNNTLILGGSDISFDNVSTQKPYELLEKFLQEHFPAGYTITYRWSGSLFHTTDGLPYAFEHPHEHGKVFIGTGLGGNGLVFGNLVARTLSQLAQGKQSADNELLSLKRTGASIKPIQRTQTTPSTSTPEPASFVPFAPIADLEKGKPICKLINGKMIVVCKVKEQYYALSNQCSHAGGSLADGTLDGAIIECPLHGAKFDITTGAVVGPPAIRSQQTYPVRKNADMLEVEVPAPGIQPQPIAGKQKHTVKPKKTYWKWVILFSLGAALFWLAEFLMQYYYFSLEDIGGSLMLSLGFTGATLFGAALLSSAVFKWKPKTARYWRLRRYLGVGGTIAITFHVLAALNYFYVYDIASLFYSFNPLENPVLFGSLAFPIFLAMAITSTDQMVDRLTAKRWKELHRFVYLAYWASICHFVMMYPVALKTLPGIILVSITTLALFGELFWFIKMASKKRFRSLGSAIGIALIILYIVSFYLIYQQGVFSLL